MMRYLFVLVAMLQLAACGGSQSCDKPNPYQQSRDGATLVVPDGLTRPPASSASIPPLGPDAPASRGPCGEVPPEDREGLESAAPAEPAEPAAAGDLN